MDSSDSGDVFSNFGALDELVQIIYQGAARFVLLSKVDDKSWIVHLGLTGVEGRWWTGSWTVEKVLSLAGPKPTSRAFEAFAQRLADAIVQGQLSVGNWDSEKGAKIELTLGPLSKKPMSVPLVELGPREAAAHATKVFMDIAFDAQSRKCKLNPPVVPSYDVPISAARSETTPDSIGSSSRLNAPTTQDKSAQDKIKLLEAKLATSEEKNKRKTSSTPEPTSIPKKVPRPKGASLANPNKKARKYQAIEFGSDEE